LAPDNIIPFFNYIIIYFYFKDYLELEVIQRKKRAALP